MYRILYITESRYIRRVDFLRYFAWDTCFDGFFVESNNRLEVENVLNSILSENLFGVLREEFEIVEVD